MKILRRYILREHVGPFVAALSVLTGLMLLNQLAKRFGDLVGKGLPWYLIAEVFGLSVPFILAMTMPMAVLVAVLYTFSRLSGDNEITAMKAGGVSLARLMVPVVIAAAVVAAGMTAFNDRVLPESNHALRKLLSDIGKKQPTFELRERVINEVSQGRLFLQAARIERARSVLHDLVIFDLGRPGVTRTIYADSGYMAFNETHTDLYLTLYDGLMLERDPDDPTTDQRSYYASQVIRVPDVSNELERGASSDFRGDREMTIAMMREEIRDRRARMAELDDSLTAIIPRLDPVRAKRVEADVPYRRIPLEGADTVGGVDTARGADTARVTHTADGAEKAQGVDTAGTQPRFRARQSAITGKALALTQRPRLDSAPAAASGGKTPPAPTRPPELTKAQDLSRRLTRGAQWPPEGGALSYAAAMRSELDRIASRRDLQRREISRYAVEIEKKFAIPAAAIVFVLIGAPIGVRFPRGGVGMVIGVSLSVFCVYYVFLIGGEEFADRNIITPFWAMWAPNVLFAAVGCGTLYLVSREGTSRVAAFKRRVGRWWKALRRPSRPGLKAREGVA